ncbi:MAG: PAS domain S-box protein [Spirochaetales bacterium]|nr:PAS domain S-box protein [Spirochaetales bacterium]
MSYIIEHSRSAIAVHDRNLRYIYVSKKYLTDYNVVEKDIIGKHHYDVFPDLPQKWRDAHKKALEGEISSAEDDIFERADGSTELTRWECRPWYEQDESIGGFVVYTEVITERNFAEIAIRKSEEKYRAIIQATRDGFWSVDKNGKCIDVNASYSRMVGYSIEELLKLGIRDVDALEDDQMIAKRIEKVRQSGFDNFSTRHKRKDGSVFDVEVSAYFLENEIICFCRDVTEMKRAM